MKSMKAPKKTTRYVCLVLWLSLALVQKAYSQEVIQVENSHYPATHLLMYKSGLDTLSYKSQRATISTLRHRKVTKMPFFCQLEHNLAKKSGFPVKFRLGDVNYVDKLENK